MTSFQRALLFNNWRWGFCNRWLFGFYDSWFDVHHIIDNPTNGAIGQTRISISIQ